MTCILPGGTGGIELDDEQICHQCRSWQPIKFHGEEALLHVLDTVRNPEQPYDCMVNISGGRDSAYTLLALVKDYKLRVLAVNYANPFTDPQAQANIQNTVHKLGVDFVQFSLKRRLHERILRNNILAWFKHPSPGMVPVICIGCKIIWPKMLKIARQHGIRCIINGGNPYEYTSFKKGLLGVDENAGLTTTYWKNIRGLATGAFRNLGYLKPQFLPATASGYLFGNPYAVGSRVLAGSMTYIDFFHYIPWREEDVLGRIRAELNWDSPGNLPSTWRFDCRIAHLKDYMYLKTIGMTEKDDFYAKMVRAGQIDRAEALERVRLENDIPYKMIYELFDQLNITTIDLEKELQTV